MGHARRQHWQTPANPHCQQDYGGHTVQGVRTCRCPYYKLAGGGVFGSLDTSTSAWSTQYWGALNGSTLLDAACPATLAALPARFQAAMLAAPGAPSCGALLQLQSLYPGRGPCYPVFLDTVDYFNRCAPWVGLGLGTLARTPAMSPDGEGRRGRDCILDVHAARHS